MALKQFHIFIAVAQRQPIMRAVEALNLAQSAVSASTAASSASMVAGSLLAELLHHVPFQLLGPVFSSF